MKTTIFDYGMNGEGVAKIDDVITLIPHSLINENVDISIVTDCSNYKIAQLNDVLTSSKMRQAPLCPYFSKCGGCDIQHMKYNEQLFFKTKLIEKTIKKISNLTVSVNPTIPSLLQFSYRNKASFNILNSCLGFFEANSKNIVKIDHCLLCSENINKVYSLFQEFCNNNNDILHQIKHLVVRDISNQILVGVVTKNKIDLSTFYALLQSNFKQIGLFQIINNRKDSVVLSGKTIFVNGIKQIEINNFNLKYNVDLLGFHQTNEDIQNKLYLKVLENIEQDDIVINGFSGQGLLSAIIASKAKKVIGIEIVKSSHDSANELKALNNIKNMTNILGDFNKKINQFKSCANTIILDPSKKGCGKDVLKNIVGVKTILYISCNPIALAKDLNVLKDFYNIIEVTPFDMFPNTKNVETFVKLQLK